MATPLVSSIVDWDEYTGRFEAVERVEVRARVSGYVDTVNFSDGQTVAAGDLLYVIDPRPFEAALAGARADLDAAIAERDLAYLDVERAESLAGTRTIPQSELDERRTAVSSAEARVAAARAALRAAELDMEFTEVRASIDGRISDRKVDVGNLVSGGSVEATLLATIVSLNPIYFIFDASEADFLKYARLHRQGTRPSSRETPNPVYVQLMDESDWTRGGVMNFVDNELDPNSGTIRGRAIFENSDGLLTPGIFGRLRLLGSGEYEALLIPDEAILADQDRKVVMTVDDDGTVVPKVVELGPLFQGLRVIRSGLAATDRVIIAGLQRARPGGKVTPQQAEIAFLTQD